MELLSKHHAPNKHHITRLPVKQQQVRGLALEFVSKTPEAQQFHFLAWARDFNPNNAPKGSLIYGDEINSNTTKGVWGGRGEPIALYDSLHKHLATWIFLKYLALQNVICLRRQDWMCPACVAGVSALASVTKDYGGSDGNLGRGREEGKNVLEMA